MSPEDLAAELASRDARLIADLKQVAAADAPATAMTPTNP